MVTDYYYYNYHDRLAYKYVLFYGRGRRRITLHKRK